MSLSINAYNQPSTDRQKARATEFINRNDREVTRMAVRSYNITHAESDRKLDKKLRFATASIPAVALASGLILKNGIKSSVKHAANWGILLAAPIVVHKLSVATSKPDKDGKKHDKMPFGIGFGLSLAGYIGGVSALNKLAQNEKVNAVADSLISGAKTTFNKVKSNINIPEGIVNKFNDVKSKIKMPEGLKGHIDKVKASESFAKFADKSAVLAKKTLNHSPSILLFGVLGVSIAAAIKQGLDISSKKAQIKNAQLDVARNLVNVYEDENRALKNA